MHGDHSLKLVQTAKRTQHLPTLPPYSTELVRTITLETRALDKDVARILSQAGPSFTPASDPATACALLVNHLSMRRNKRCLLAYHRVRAEKLEGMAWEGQDPMEHAASNDTQENSLSPEEESYFRQCAPSPSSSHKPHTNPPAQIPTS